MPDHHLRPFTPERLDVVRQRWRSLSGEDEFEVEMAAFFGWCNAHINPQDGDSQALELHDPARDETDAILEIVEGKRGTMSKLLKLFVSPEFWSAEDSQQMRIQIVELHVAAFSQVINAGIAKGAREVKIYGRSNLMLSILKALQAQWPSEQTGWDAAMAGRWLAISRRG